MAHSTHKDIPALALRGDFAPSSANAEKRTVDVTWTTGARVLRQSWFDGPFYEELSLDPKHVRMGRLQSGAAPFLANHSGYNVNSTLGVIESAQIEGGKGIATVRFPKEGIDPAADQVFRKIQDGIIRNVSVGYRVHKFEKQDGSNKDTPVFRAVDWEPHEVSAVAIPADAGATFRAAGDTNPCEFITRGLPQEEQQTMEKPEIPAPVQTEAAREVDVKAVEERARTAERERIAAIEKSVRSAKLPDEMARKLIDGGVSLDAARAQILDALAERSESTPIDNHQRIEVGETDSEKWVRGVSAAMLSRSGKFHGVATVKDEHSKREVRHQNTDLVRALDSFDPRDNGGEFRSFSLVDLARESLERRNIKTRGWTSEKIVQRALYARDNGGQQTTSDFSVALENVMYKVLLGAYAQEADTWRRWAGVDSVQDFRPSNRYRLGSFSVLDPLDENGEYKTKAIPDAIKQTISTETFGNRIALSRKAIINDDMGAVVASADRFGRMAGLSIEVASYALLAQNSGLGPSVTYNGTTANLCDASFGNLGTGAALSADALVADYNVMASQKDPSNNEVLSLVPNVLLVPLTLGATAKQINRASYDPTPGSAFMAPNKAAGLFRDVVETPRLTGTRRYMFTDKTPAVVVVFLNGTQIPLLESRMGWEIDGVEYKIRLDYNVQPFDPKGIVTNAGV